MNWRDIRPGVEVYHSLFTHWGKGIVEEVVGVGCLEAIFERGSKRIRVKFEGHDNVAVVRLYELRKRPNRKKIKAMVAFHQQRGTKAEDGGDRLILPERIK